MKIQCISDLHGQLPDGIDCDLLLIGGDICPLINHHPWFQKMWFESTFTTWLKTQKYGKAVLVAGNHDFVFEENGYKERAKHVLKDVNGVYLQDESFVYKGFNIYGSPWQPIFHDWAFNLSEENLAKKWLTIPADCDILLLHGPPRGFGCGGLPGAGSPSLTQRIAEVKPKLVVCGHIHSAYGEYHIGDTKILNVSSVNEKYKLRSNPIWSIEL